MAKTPRQTLIQRARRNPGVLRRALRNPKQRSMLPDNMVSAKLRQQRIRLRQPITPGSSVTERGLGHEAKAAMAVKYGPVETAQRQQLGEAKNYQHDIAGYYSDYLQRIARQAANVRTLGDAASQQIQNLQGGVTGLANTDLTQLNQRATADAAGRGATSGDLSQMASNAAAVRQALVGSFGAQQAATNNAAARYADAHANVIGPGQRLQAIAGAAGRVRQVREQRTSTARQKGADNVAFRDQRRADEAKMVLARQTLGGNLAENAAQAEGARATRTETRRSHRAQERLDAAKLRTDRQTAAGKVNAYGYTDHDWRSMSTAERRKIIAAKGGGSGSGGKGKGPKMLTPGQSGAGLSQAVSLKGLAEKARDGKPFIAGHNPEPRRDRHAAARKILDYVGPKVKHPILITAALDAVYIGHLSPPTVKALRKAGYSPSEVASSLGTRTAGDWRKHTTAGRNYVAYGHGSGPTPMGHK